MANNSYQDKLGRYPIKPVRIENVDQAVADYFDKKLDIQVDVERGRRKVPVTWATGERWKIIRKNKFRDENGTLILPLISIKRTDIDKTPGFGGLGQETPSITIRKEIHPKTGNIQNLVKKRRASGFYVQKQDPVYSVLTIPFPDFSTLTYEISIWCQYETQMNEIIEKIFHNYEYKQTSSFVMPMDYDGKLPKGDGYYFVGFREGNVTPQSNTEDFTDQERIIKYTYTMKTPAYLILDPKDEPLTYGKDRESKDSTGKKVVYEEQTANQVDLSEQVLTLEEFEKLFG
jgi:hypothetical protein